MEGIQKAEENPADSPEIEPIPSIPQIPYLQYYRQPALIT
jgi:hypothetical protein